MNPLKKAKHRIKVISLFGVSQIVSILSVVLLSLVIVRFKSVELWGEYAEILIWSNLFLLFLSFGNNDYLLKTFSEFPSKVNQKWLNNILVRSFLLIPSGILIFFTPAFLDIEIDVLLLVLLKFLNQSFKSLIVFNRKFKLNIGVESFFLVTLLLMVILEIEVLNLKILIQLIVIALTVKFLTFLYFFIGDFKNTPVNFQFKELKKSLPFFIPLALGTLRSRVDTYYGALFFNFTSLSKYQMLISFLALSQMASAFFITPYLKNYYRFKNQKIKDIQKKFFFYGWGFAFFATLIISVVLNYLYRFTFSKLQYGLAFLFIVPLFLNILLVNEYYKKNHQIKIAYFTSLILIFQLFAGYFLIKYWNITGALLLKVLGQWAIVVLLWFWIKKTKN